MLEDIDSTGIGLSRNLENHSIKEATKESGEDKNKDEDETETESYGKFRAVNMKTGCTLSGLLNVLDGVTSHQGRIVLMTSNIADKLDPALVRPGRIDKKIFLGYMSQESANKMFLTMYKNSADMLQLDTSAKDLSREKLEELAAQYSKQIPEQTFSPAQLQGYLLSKKESPFIAVTDIAGWVQGKLAKRDGRKSKAEIEKAQSQPENAKKHEGEKGIEDEKNVASGTDTEKNDGGSKDGLGRISNTTTNTTSASSDVSSASNSNSESSDKPNQAS